jgi:hypothetical protein
LSVTAPNEKNKILCAMAAERLRSAPTLYGADQLDHHVRMALAICTHAGLSAQQIVASVLVRKHGTASRFHTQAAVVSRTIKHSTRALSAV